MTFLSVLSWKQWAAAGCFVLAKVCGIAATFFIMGNFAGPAGVLLSSVFLSLSLGGLFLLACFAFAIWDFCSRPRRTWMDDAADAGWKPPVQS